jgi:predicted metal-dependent hydrolase
MHRKKYHIVVNGWQIEVVRKNIKYLHLWVYPPDGRTLVTTPLRVTDEEIRRFVDKHLVWIQQQKEKYAAQAPLIRPEFVTGERLYYRGQHYLLNVIVTEEKARLEIRHPNIMDLYIHPGSEIADRARIINHWYRQRLKEEIVPLIAKWEAEIGVKALEWRVRQMRTKWGTCNTRAKRIWLNLDLMKKPVHCLEYVLVHELVHLLERQHNDRFFAYMDHFMPLWRIYREELNQTPLDHNFSEA